MYQQYISTEIKKLDGDADEQQENEEQAENESNKNTNNPVPASPDGVGPGSVVAESAKNLEVPAENAEEE